MIRILLHSEDHSLQPLLSSAIGKEFQILLAANEEVLQEFIAKRSFDVLLIDLDSGQGSLRERIALSERLISARIPAVVMADDALRSTANDLVRLGAHGFCRRPPSIRDLKMMLFRAYENASYKCELRAVEPPAARAVVNAGNGFDGMIGSSPQMREVYDLVDRVSRIGASVLITGESGTGKELIARSIHNLGSRSSHPFVAVCCGAIPETLIEAELFGHEKGAFTGATGARVGFLEQAGEGTLFLDEIGELSLSTQVKLLRVIQQREFCRLGNSRPIPLCARLVFATHRDLEGMVALGTFRQDLFYRINVMRIEAPALHEHAEDISGISLHFLRHYSNLYQKPMTSIEPTAMSAMQTYAWPGNVRELENVIQRAIIFASGETLQFSDLPCHLREQNVVCIEDVDPSGSFERQLRDFKVKLATNAVRDNHGNKTLAARNLHISRAYLHRLIRLAEPGLIAESEFYPLSERLKVATA